MSTNYVQPGKILDYTNNTAAPIPMGTAIVVGTRVAVIIAGDRQNPGPLRVGVTGAAQICGTFRLPKTPADVIAQGALVYLTSVGVITTTAAGNTLAGIAFNAAGNGATSVEVLLNGLPV